MLNVKKLALPLFIFLTLLLCLLIQYWGYDFPGLGIDDANIYFVYMKNVANGHGFVWNVGGERVEGFTSFLWTVIGAGVYKMTPVYFSKVLISILFILTYLTVYQVLVFVRRLNKTTEAVIAPSDVIILSALLLPLGFVDWNILSLMETGLWTFLLTTTLLEVCRYILQLDKLHPVRLSFLMIAMVITRPESMAYNLLIIACLFVYIAVEKEYQQGLKKTVPLVIVHFAAIAAIIFWRISYFGFPFPNTYYAKVSSSILYNIKSSASYLVIFFYSYPLYIFIGIVLAFFAASIFLKYRKKGMYKLIEPEEKVQLFLFIITLAVFLLPLLTGGDHFKYCRFYQPVLPVTLISACNYYCWNKYVGIKFQSGKKPALVLATAFACMMILSCRFTMFDFITSKSHKMYMPVMQEFFISKDGREVADKMNETFDGIANYPSVGTLATGGFGFVYKGNTIDLLGLNNVIMAHADPNKKGYRDHASFDRNAFFKLKPDIMGSFYGVTVVTDTGKFVLPENDADFHTDMNFMFLIYKHVFDDPRFLDMYQPALIRNKKKDFYIFDYFNKQYIQTIDTTKLSFIPLKRKFKPAS